LAISLALDAGERLRNEFCRDGGPRGSGGHAPIDTEVETEIRDGLLEAFPRYGYLGEETGTVGAGTRSGVARGDDGSVASAAPGEAAPGASIWVVDPNDGTSAFQEGYRGASVSIALVRDAVPVLGVVYAYNAPTDDGEIFAWAEGCAPMRWSPGTTPRPVVTVDPGRGGGGGHGTAAPDEGFTSNEPSLDLPVLVSHKGDSLPEANARLAAPRRYRTVVGIAYRLALTAAGDGAAATTLTGPWAWDMAAGHALLRGAGFDLFTAEGTPVRYDADGRCTRSEAYFGGHPAVVRRIIDNYRRALFDPNAPERRRDGRSEIAGAVRLPTGLDLSLVAPRRPVRCVPAAVLDRVLGTFLGAVAGDSLGSLVEFLPPEEIAGRYPATGGPTELADGGTWGTIAGQPTDDTEMALLLARSIVARGYLSLDDVTAAYRWWLDSGPFDVGNTVSGALRGRPNPGSQANGALMRVAPLGIYAAGRRWGSTDGTGTDASGDLRREIADPVRAEAALTHVHPVCAAVNVLYVDAIATAILDGVQPAELFETVLGHAGADGVPPEVRDWTEAAASAPPEEYLRQQGWVRIAWQNALYQLRTAADPFEGIVDTVRRGGDTDTNAAIAGALLGAVYGASAFPPRWRGIVSSARALEVAGARRPRPAVLWPVDWEVLAERVFLAGFGTGVSDA
ncbi:MAG: inositol monophosphatase family protein, partial [Alkalispirochaeta sp.]